MNYCHRWILSGTLALVVGCTTVGQQSQQPRIMEVTRNTRVKGYTLPEQRDDFYVVWAGANITLVKFEYRQVHSPNELFAKSYVPTTKRFYDFTVAGDDFRKGGRVSAWRVTLWQNQQVVAEQKSALW